MSLYIDFEPHSWYMGFAIKHNKGNVYAGGGNWYDAWGKPWQAYTDNGNTYNVDKVEANTLKELKQLIKQYRIDENERTARLYKELEQ